MVGVGNIVSVGGFGAGGGGGGGGSGIQELNGQTGPIVTLVGTSGIVVSPVAPNQLNIGFTGSVTQSGVLGVNGIDVQQVGGSFIVDGAALSGLIAGGDEDCYSALFGPTTSGQFNHNLGTRKLVVQVQDDSSPPQFILPDAIRYDTLDTISVLFNRPQSGRVVILSCQGPGLAPTGVDPRVELDLAFKSAFNDNTYSEITRTAGRVSQIDIWEDNSKANQLFTKVITRSGGSISQVVITDNQTGASLTTDIGRDGGGTLTTVTKTFTE